MISSSSSCPAVSLSAASAPSVERAPASTPAGISVKRLAQASGLEWTDRLLVNGILQGEAVTALAATGVSAVTLVRPDRSCPRPERAEVVWLLGVDRVNGTEQRLGSALQCLVPGGRLLVEFITSGPAQRAAALAALLRRRGMEAVRVETLHADVVLVRGRAPAQRRRAA